MIACWALLIISLVLSGISLIFITLAASKSIYTHAPYLNFLSQTTMSHISWLSAIIAGTFFAGALSLMVLATQRSIRNKHTEAMSEIK
jgi:hypothetical protein